MMDGDLRLTDLGHGSLRVVWRSRGVGSIRDIGQSNTWFCVHTLSGATRTVKGKEAAIAAVLEMEEEDDRRRDSARSLRARSRRSGGTGGDRDDPAG